MVARQGLEPRWALVVTETSALAAARADAYCFTARAPEVI